MIAKKRVLFMLGGPGAGKGTQCALLQKSLDCGFFSAGDLLRKQRQSQSQLAKEINQCIKIGKIVRAEITVDLIKKAMKSCEDKNLFLIDGFPRNQDNLDTWNSHIGEQVQIFKVIHLLASDQVLKERIVKRTQIQNRDDDSQKVFKLRMQVYKNETLPIVDKLKLLGIVQEIRAEGTKQEIFDSILSTLYKPQLKS